MTVLTLPDPAPRTAGKFGKLEAKNPVQLNFLSAYGALPAAPSVVQRKALHSVIWGMLGNAQYGDCTFAGYVHLVIAVAALLDIKMSFPDAAAVVRAYLIYDHGQDTGAVESDLLQTAYGTGLMGLDLAGYAPTNNSVTEMCEVVNVFGAAYIGVMMTNSDIVQFNNHEPWKLTSDTTIVGGHCVIPIGYDAYAEMARVVTWGTTQLVEFAWLRARMDECWAVIPSAVKTTGKLDNFNWTQLSADIHALGGVHR